VGGGVNVAHYTLKYLRSSVPNLSHSPDGDPFDVAITKSLHPLKVSSVRSQCAGGGHSLQSMHMHIQKDLLLSSNINANGSESANSTMNTAVFIVCIQSLR